MSPPKILICSFNFNTFAILLLFYFFLNYVILFLR
nr:MAG TPA: hypothetical protein [Caudoviricetes sp.]